MYVRTERMSDHFVKYHLNDEGQLPVPCAPVLHHFTSADDGCFHDHPFGLWCTVLHGGYVEESLDPSTSATVTCERVTHETFYIPATHIHRVVDLPHGECVTVSLYGPWERHVRLWRLHEGRVEWCPADEGRWQWRA